MKKLTIRQVAAIKRNAQNVAPLVSKKQRILEKVQELREEYASLEEQISAIDAGTKVISGGYSSEQLITKVVKPTGKLDDKGKEIKVTTFVPNPSILQLDEEGKSYNIIVDETPDPLMEDIAQQEASNSEAQDSQDSQF